MELLHASTEARLLKRASDRCVASHVHDFQLVGKTAMEQYSTPTDLDERTALESLNDRKEPERKLEGRASPGSVSPDALYTRYALRVIPSSLLYPVRVNHKLLLSDHV